jgi:hypothetical protein
LVAGVDISVQNRLQIARGAVVVLSFPELKPVESQISKVTGKFFQKTARVFQFVSLLLRVGTRVGGYGPGSQFMVVLL